jgi:restriction endonuclease Mrr
MPACSVCCGVQGAFITTADFQSSAADIAVEPVFPRIGLVKGLQLVDLLVERWNDKEFQDRLGLKSGWLESEAVWSLAVPISTKLVVTVLSQ